MDRRDHHRGRSTGRRYDDGGRGHRPIELASFLFALEEGVAGDDWWHFTQRSLVLTARLHGGVVPSLRADTTQPDRRANPRPQPACAMRSLRAMAWDLRGRSA